MQQWKWHRHSQAVRVGCVMMTTIGLGWLGGLSSFVMANPHTTILKKNTPTSFAVREELEGSSSIVNHINIPHGCNGIAIQAMSVVFPNGEATAVRTDTQEEVELTENIDGLPVQGVKAIQDHRIFRKIQNQRGLTAAGTTDVRAIHYSKGRLDPDLVGLVPWRGTFPRFTENSCATTLHVNMAIANYCTKSKTNEDRADVWMGMLTPLFDDPVVVVQSPPGFWPTLAVVRDLDNNPLPVACGDGFEIAVSPTAHDIDQHLPIKGFWPVH